MTLPFEPKIVAKVARERRIIVPAKTVTQLNGETYTAIESEIVSPEFADDALALGFSTKYGDVLRYVAAWGQWMAWDGTVWKKDDTLRVYDLVRGACRVASAEAKQPSMQSKLASGRTVAAVEKLARADRRHAASVHQWDANPWLLNTPRGIVDLHTGEFLPHASAHHMMKCTSVSPFGDCPRWMEFLATVTGGDKELQSYLQRMAGYALTGDIREEKLFFLYGTGGNGKGTFLNTIQAIMGDYALTASTETFTANAGNRHLTELARLQGARLVVAQETEEGKELAEARVKAITGGDPITANFMRQDPFTFMPQFKLVISGNHKPSLKNIDKAIRRRFNLIPFNARIDNPDLELKAALQAEGAGILQWMVDGCIAWNEERLNAPNSVEVATGEYFEGEDAIGLWIEQRCRLGPQSYARSGDLFRSWSKWAKASGEEVGSQKRFSQALISRDFSVKKSDGYPTFNGIEIIHSRAPTETEDERA